jgi:hypothetical protein
LVHFPFLDLMGKFRRRIETLLIKSCRDLQHDFFLLSINVFPAGDVLFGISTTIKNVQETTT